MRVLLAKPRGFCAGVNMAIECLEEALRLVGSPLYVYHEIVHNKYVVESFTQRGVIFVDRLEDVPEDSLLLYSAHGVSPAIRELARTRRLRTIDATCPLVTKVHLEAIRFAQNGYHIILIGHAGHDEVIGTMGEAPDHITLVESVQDVHALPFTAADKLAYLTQTTLSVQEADVIIQALKRRYPQIVGPPKEDICYATTNRQEVVQKLLPEVDVLVVLGSQNSSNSRRLMEIGLRAGKPAYLIDGVHELQAAWLEHAHTVLVTAGASAPEKVVQDCLRHLQEKYQAVIEERALKEEHVSFPLPKELRDLVTLTA